MSGGAFDYAYSRVKTFVDDLDDKLNNPEEFSPEVIAALYVIKTKAMVTAELMRAAEWLYSGNDSEETFLNKVANVYDNI